MVTLQTKILVNKAIVLNIENKSLVFSKFEPGSGRVPEKIEKQLFQKARIIDKAKNGF